MGRSAPGILTVLLVLVVVFVSSCASSGANAATKENPAGASSLPEGIEKGSIPPDFTITTIEGKEISLFQLRGEKPVLLYFFATWCPYCREDFSVVKNIYPSYADEVMFLAIDLDLDENANVIRHYQEGEGLSKMDFARGRSDILSDYAIRYTTTKYALGKDGRIIYKGSGVFSEEQWHILLGSLAEST